MKKLITLLLMSFFVFGCGHIPANNNEKIFSPKNLLIDVRTPMEFQQGHLKKAVNIPLNKIKEDIKYFAPDKKRTVIVYCLSGKRAEIAAKELKDLGYNNVINAGKYMELKKIEEKRSMPDHAK